MNVVIRLFDERVGLPRQLAWELGFDDVESLTARELITRRVREEATRLDAQVEGAMRQARAEALIECPTERLAGLIDVDDQIARVFEAFERNGFFLLVDDRQVTSLDDALFLTPDSEVCFVRLFPLVGG